MVKGETEQIPDTITKTPEAVFEIYTKSELAEFYKHKTQFDLPKGNKSIGVQKLAERCFHDIQCLAQANGQPTDLTWPPSKLMSSTSSVASDISSHAFTAVGKCGDPTSELPTKVSDTVVTDGDLKPAAKVQAASLS